MFKQILATGAMLFAAVSGGIVATSNPAKAVTLINSYFGDIREKETDLPFNDGATIYTFPIVDSWAIEIKDLYIDGIKYNVDFIGDYDFYDLDVPQPTPTFWNDQEAARTAAETINELFEAVGITGLPYRQYYGVLWGQGEEETEFYGETYRTFLYEEAIYSGNGNWSVNTLSGPEFYLSEYPFATFEKVSTQSVPEKSPSGAILLLAGVLGTGWTSKQLAARKNLKKVAGVGDFG